MLIFSCGWTVVSSMIALIGGAFGVAAVSLSPGIDVTWVEIGLLNDIFVWLG